MPSSRRSRPHLVSGSRGPSSRVNVPWHEDVGVQPERTSLAWSRTALSLAVVSGVFLRWAREFGPWMLLIIAGFLLTAAYIITTSRRRYSRGVHGIIDEKVQPNSAAVMVMTSSIIIMGLITISLMLIH